MPAAQPNGTTIQRIKSSLRFNFALLDRRPRAERKDPDPKERARLQTRIAQLRADLHRAQAAAPTPKPAAPARRSRKATRPDPTELFPVFAKAQADEHERHRAATAAEQPAQDAPAARPWDTGGRGPVGSRKVGQAVLRCPHCKVTFYERPKCPSCSKSPTPLHP